MSVPEMNFSQLIGLSLEMDNYLELQKEGSEKTKIQNLIIRSFESPTDHFTVKQEKGWFARTWDRFTALFRDRSKLN